jgi:hypothetical protein
MRNLDLQHLRRVALARPTALMDRWRQRSDGLQLRSNLPRSFAVLYDGDTDDYLATLCERYGSDKGAIREDGHVYAWPAHTYADFYARLFGHCRQTFRAVFECGLGTNNPDLPSSMGARGRPGASLRVWREYFPNATIVGADVDRQILFQEERISTYFVDQTNPHSVRALWRQVPAKMFDLMIDDGLHTYAAGICLFENSVERLTKDGIYIIEDAYSYDLLEYRRYFRNTPYRVDYVMLAKDAVQFNDNNLVVIRAPRIGAAASL